MELDALKIQQRDDEKLKAILVEFEFNSIGKRLFGDDFKAGRGFVALKTETAPADKASAPAKEKKTATGELALGLDEAASPPVAEETPAPPANLKTIADVPHEYHLVSTPAQRADLIKALQSKKSF